jgi:hypothetical protein
MRVPHGYIRVTPCTIQIDDFDKQLGVGAMGVPHPMQCSARDQRSVEMGKFHLDRFFNKSVVGVLIAKKII